MTQKLAKMIDIPSCGKQSLLGVSFASSILAVNAMIGNPVQAANLIQNGSFETSIFNPGNSFIGLTNGSTAITGWTVSQGAIDYIGTLWQASDGSRSIDLNGTGVAGEIRQTFNTTIGQTYRVTFDMAGNTFAGPNIKNMRVSAGGNSADFSFDITGKSRQNMGWLTKTWDFTATSTTTNLSFLSLLTGGSAGPTLDNVSVEALPSTPVPEPLTILGAGTAVAFGTGFKRKLAKAKKQ